MLVCLFVYTGGWAGNKGTISMIYWWGGGGTTVYLCNAYSEQATKWKENDTQINKQHLQLLADPMQDHKTASIRFLVSIRPLPPPSPPPPPIHSAYYTPTPHPLSFPRTPPTCAMSLRISKRSIHSLFFFWVSIYM